MCIKLLKKQQTKSINNRKKSVEQMNKNKTNKKAHGKRGFYITKQLTRANQTSRMLTVNFDLEIDLPATTTMRTAQQMELQQVTRSTQTKPVTTRRNNVQGTFDFEELGLLYNFDLSDFYNLF